VNSVATRSTGDRARGRVPSTPPRIVVRCCHCEGGLLVITQRDGGYLLGFLQLAWAGDRIDERGLTSRLPSRFRLATSLPRAWRASRIIRAVRTGSAPRDPRRRSSRSLRDPSTTPHPRLTHAGYLSIQGIKGSQICPLNQQPAILALVKPLRSSSASENAIVIC
jgi:hypothetical protein